MPDQFARTALLFGVDNMEKLRRSRVAVFGIGGVGGACAEALCRAGIGAIDLFDHDRVGLTNLNRQIVATHSTIGQFKVDAMEARMRDINPAITVGAYKVFYSADTADGIDLTQYDYIVDAMDTMTAKLELITRAYALNAPLISSMGAANKLDAAAFRVADINKTMMCPLARIVRKELRKRGVKRLKVVYSPEPAMAPREDVPQEPDAIHSARRQLPASCSFVPPAAGLIMAGEVVRDLTGLRGAEGV